MKLLTAEQIAELDDYPNASPRIIWRWMRKGLVGADGQRRYCKSVKIGHAFCTCEQWLNDFFNELAVMPIRHEALGGAVPPSREAKMIKASDEAIDKALLKLGI